MKEDNLVLKQILSYIEKIERYMLGVSHDEFLLDQKLQDAVIRNIEIIGEASNRLSETFLSENLDFPISEAISMRNRLIHGYDDIDLEIVWNTINLDIKTLKATITKLF